MVTMTNRTPRHIATTIAVSLFAATTALGAPLKVACYKDYAPYAELDDDGEMRGVVVELWEAWSEKTGIPITFLPMTLTDGIAAVETGKADLFCGLFFTEKRAETLAFSDATLRMKTLLFVRNDIKEERVDALSVPISVVDGDFALPFLNARHPQLPLSVLPTHGALLSAVTEQSVEAFIYDYPARFPGFKTLPAPEGYRKTEILYSERLRAAVKRDNIKLAETVNNGLALISESELWRIASKWNLYQEDDTLFVIAVASGGALLAFLILGGIYLMKLRSKLAVAYPETPSDLLALIAKGENDTVEFKSSLRWDYKQEKVNKVLEQVVAKTISAFLNADGGRLFIGVNDDGNLLGLENDYRTFNKKPNADGFLLALGSVINKMLGKRVHQFISVRIDTIDDKDLCSVVLRPSDAPVFLKNGNTEEFYIRAQASSQPLGMKDACEYVISKWHGK